MCSDWLKLDKWLATSMHSALFHFEYCFWHRLQSISSKLIFLIGNNCFSKFQNGDSTWACILQYIRTGIHLLPTIWRQSWIALSNQHSPGGEADSVNCNALCTVGRNKVNWTITFSLLGSTCKIPNCSSTYFSKWNYAKISHNCI